jgi:hypothetical protein
MQPTKEFAAATLKFSNEAFLGRFMVSVLYSSLPICFL